MFEPLIIAGLLKSEDEMALTSHFTILATIFATNPLFRGSALLRVREKKV